MTEPYVSIPSRGMRRIGVVAKRGSRQAAELAAELVEWLSRRELEPLVDPATAEELKSIPGGLSGPGLLSSAARADLVVVLGGDGTLLAVARKAAGGPPILGVNLGRLGFLTEVQRNSLYPALVEVLAGRYALEPRSLFEVEQIAAGESEPRAGFRALNDVVIAKSALSRVIELSLSVDGHHVARYRADGIVVSTPTGSTAYNLSAGGPILHPLLPVAVITPICPHTLTLRPLVVPDSSAVEIVIESRNDEGDDRVDRVYLTVDGQEGGDVAVGDRVRVKRSPRPAYLVRTGKRGSIFDGLRTKLHWGE
ncbi:MAG: NAD(+)/NADH kinase [Thermoanaerobaculia bacterium]